MNKLITILSFSLAVPAFVAIFTQSKIAILLSAVIALLICLLFFWIDSVLRKKGSKIINAIFYFFAKENGMYSISEQCVLYERKDATNWEYTKKYRLRSLNNTFNYFDDRFCWSSDSNIAKINAINQNHSVTNIRGEEIWTAYTIKFDTIPKGKEISTGAKITELVDSEQTVRPFLSSTILRKTRLLRMSVKIPKDFKPTNPKIEVYSDISHDAQSSRISSEPLVYNKSTQEIELPPVEYPRKGWRYVIVWEYKN